MNISVFSELGGYPFDTERLDDMQKSYSIFNALGYMAGDYAILTGCTQSGNTVSDGVVVINGEVLPFRTGTVSALSRVVILETETKKPFKNGESKTVYKTRTAAFGVGNGSIAWTSFKRVNPLLEMQKATVPVGLISMWSGAINAIPAGWRLCDGTNNTPNLKGRFVVGYDANDIDYNATTGKTGGAKSVALTIEQMPSHKHPSAILPAGDHKHSGLSLRGSNADEGDPGNYVITANIQANGNQPNAGETNIAGSHEHTITMENTGGGQAHENRPPYYTLAYIIFTGN